MRTLYFPWLCLCLLLGSVSTALAGNDLTMKATLIWGCDEEKPNDPKIKPVSPEMAKRLRGIFKWKYYFEVKTESAKIAEKGTKDFVLSDKCTVKLKNDGKSYEAKLFGENKLLKAISQQISIGALSKRTKSICTITNFSVMDGFSFFLPTSTRSNWSNSSMALRFASRRGANLLCAVI